MNKLHTPELLYQNVDVRALDKVGNYYCKHLQAMTDEDLRSKSDIAAQLGIRDLRIHQLERQNAELKRKLEDNQCVVELLQDAIVAIAEDGYTSHGVEGMTEEQEICHKAYLTIIASGATVKENKQ